MGKGGSEGKPVRATEAQPQAQMAAETPSSDVEARFMARLQEMMGGAELTEESMRQAISSMTAEQRAELLSEGQELKQEILTKEEKKEERQLFFQTINKSADEAQMPIDKDTEFLAKKICAFMSSSAADLPQQLLLEALASTPYFVKAALKESRDPSVTPVPPADLEEIEAALSLLKVEGWRSDSADAQQAARPPYVRRNLLLLTSHLHRERLRALNLQEATTLAATETVRKARRLLDMLFAYSLRCSWIKALLTITELQGLLVTGLWDHSEDECRQHMKTRLRGLGLKMPKVSVQGACGDVQPGEVVTLKVALHRTHAHSESELAEYKQMAADEADGAEEQVGAAGDAEVGGADGGETDPASEMEEAGKEGWWLLVESMRGMNGLQQAGLQSSEPVHNALVGWAALAPTLDQQSVEVEVRFNAPTSPGDYKVVAHVRSSSMVGVDCKRKVSFTVQRAKRALPSSSGSGSTEPAETVAAMDAAIAEMTAEELATLEADELKKKQADAAKKAAEKEALEEANAKKALELEASGKKAAGGLHKFDASEVDVHGGNATADDFMDAFGF